MIKYMSAAAALSLFAVPAMAQTQTAREAVVINISIADTARDADGAQRIAYRIDRAISKACEPAEDALKARLSPDWQCRRELRRDAMAKLAVMRQADGERVAVTSSAVAITR